MRFIPLAGLPPFALELHAALSTRPPLRRESEGATMAAVLVALFTGPLGEPRTWLLLRPKELRTHSGQVALPGGKMDPSDPHLVETALREAEEEIGLSRERVQILGVADDLVTTTGYVITPVVGWITAPFEPIPNIAEVSRTFSAPLALFGKAGILESIPFEPLRRAVRLYRVDGEIVWGATAAILHALAQRVPLLEP